MYKPLLFLSLAALAAQPALGRSLSPDEALDRAFGSVRKVAAHSGANRRTVVAEPVLTVGSNESPSIYVFNRADNGFMIVSADEVAAPVLGYSDTGSFDPENMPENLKGWLENCSRQIKMASAAGAEPYFDAREADHEPIEPLLKTKWDQIAPFNNDCPMLNGNRCVTGCVATAMAQVMKYFEWPEQADADAVITYRWRTGQQDLTADFSNYKFDWDNMLDKYSGGSYTEEQGSAVAKLLQACGYSVDMDYNLATNGSAAFNTVAGKGLAQYFNYDRGLHNEPRDVYSANDWENMIYDNLSTCGPVIYWGGIHCFVCDGYMGNGYFHFNWGWAGDGDGYFLLNALNPTNVGTGGSAAGYNSNQGALLGIKKPSGDQPSERNYTFYFSGITNFSTSGTYLRINSTFTNYSPYTVNPEWVYQIYNEEETEHVATVPCTTPSAGSSFSPDLNNTLMSGGILTSETEDGVTYHIYPAVRIDGKEYQFKCPPSMPGYVIYTRTRENGSPTASAELPDVGQPVIKDLSTNGNIYYNQVYVKISGIAEFTGDASTTLKLTFRMQSKKDNTWYVGDDLVVDFVPGGKPFEAYCRRKSTSSFETGEYIFALSTMDSNGTYHNLATCDVEILPYANSQYSVTAFNVENAAAVDPEDINLSVDIKGDTGYAYEQILFRIFDPEGTKVWEGESTLYVSAPNSATVSTTASLADAIPGATYTAKAYKKLYGAWSDMTQAVPFTIATSGTVGIREIPGVALNGDVITAPAAITSVSLFTLSGQPTGVKVDIDGPTARLDLGALAKGLYIARVATAEGSHAVKILKK